MEPKIEQLTAQMDRKPGASIEDIQSAFSPFNFEPPGDYVEFMTETNGSEGRVGRSYLALFSLEELKNRNASTRDIEPNLLFFGSDRGGEGYAFELDGVPGSIVAVEFVDLDRTRAKRLGCTLLEFLELIQSGY